MHNILKYFFKFKNKDKIKNQGQLFSLRSKVSLLNKSKNKFKNQGQLFSLRSKVCLLCRRFLASSERQNQVQVQVQKSSSNKKIKIRKLNHKSHRRI
jgi:hypothetical protein